jgi:hypothetical protein
VVYGERGLCEWGDEDEYCLMANRLKRLPVELSERVESIFRWRIGGYC